MGRAIHRQWLLIISGAQWLSLRRVNGLVCSRYRNQLWSAARRHRGKEAVEFCASGVAERPAHEPMPGWGADGPGLRTRMGSSTDGLRTE